MNRVNNQALIKTKAYINGQWLDTENRCPVYDPADQTVLAEVSDGSTEHAHAAIDAAAGAFVAWSKRPAAERARLMRRWFDLMMENQQDLATILTLEQGKPHAEAMGEIAYGASYLEWFAEEGKRVYGDTIPSLNADQRILVIKQPVGVVTAITPWNFPNAMIARKAAAALAAGCTFVVRPDMQTPLSALAMAELADQAGIPAGVFNVVLGSDAPAIGKVLTEHPKVAKFTFTGSTAVGKKLIAQCAGGVKKVSMELGGNAPFIVFDDADLDAAVSGALTAKYRNAGQTCVCSNRIFVQQGIYDAFVAKYLAGVETLKLGHGLSEGVHIGPLISARACEQVDALVQSSIAQGAKLMLGGRRLSPDSQYYQPTVLTEVSNDMPVASNEIFGPVTPIIAFTDEADAIAQANDTDYGLAAYFYSRDLGRVWRVSEALEYGMIGINSSIISNAAAPFGGVKQSGNGREGSKYGLDDYLEIKYLLMGGLEG